MIDLFVFFSLYKKQRMTNELLAEQLVMHETMRALRIMFHARSISKSQTFWKKSKYSQLENLDDVYIILMPMFATSR